MADIITINDDNYRQFISPVVNGERKKCHSYGVWRPSYQGSEQLRVVPFEESGIALIPESEWDDRIRQQEKDESSLEHFCRDMNVQPMDQDGTSLCWAFGVTQCAQIVRLQQSGQYIPLSPASVAAYITNFRDQGGWGDSALEGMVKRGINTQDEWSAYSLSRSNDTPENRERAKRNLVIECCEIKTREQGGSANLQGYPVGAGYNWWSHLVCLLGVKLGTHAQRLINSWGQWGEQGYGWIEGNKRKFDGAVAIMSMQTI